MFRPFALSLGLRYTRAKRRNHFISFIALSSMLGIALGITALITVLSVMNGFDYEIRSRILGMAPQVSVASYTGSIHQWQQLEQKLSKEPGVTETAPYVTGQGLLSNIGQQHAAYIYGVNPQSETNMSEISSKIIDGSWDALQPGKFGMVIGQQLAENLGLRVGDKVTLLIPEMTITPINVMPRFKRFTIVGIFHVGNGFGFDSGLAYINIKDAQKLYTLGSSVTGIRLKLKDFYAAPSISVKLMQQLPESFSITNWTQTYGALFKAIRLEKTMMFLMLLLIVAVAAFNLVSTLVMAVTDKEADIAILRTFGATPRTIMGIFMVQGVTIGLVGMLFGLAGGIWLALHVTNIVNWIESTFHVQLLSANVYYVNYLPSKLSWDDVFHVCIAAVIMSLLATLYPAWRASRVQPAEALRYE